MPSEPSWSKEMISSSTVCTWFYALALLNLALGVAGIIRALYLFLVNKSYVLVSVIIMLSAMIGITNSWFFFLICDRGINN
jgi:hypothetical protein